MKNFCLLLAVAVAASCASVATANKILFEETFFVPPDDPDHQLSDYGWTVDTPEPDFSNGGPGPWYHGSFDQPIIDGTGAPINGQSGVFLGRGGPVDNGLATFYVIDGAGGFTPIDPAEHEQLHFRVYANLQGGGTDDEAYFTVRLGDRTPQWYISSTPMEMPVASGDFYNLRYLEFDPSPGNWNLLDGIDPNDPDNSIDPAIGAPAGDLSGQLITGAGIALSLTNGEGDFSSINFADYHIKWVPEPTSAIMLGIAGIFVLAVRRRTN